MTRNHTVNDIENRKELRATLEECSTCVDVSVDPWQIDDNIDSDTSYPTSIEEEIARLETLKSYSILDSEREDSFERVTALAARVFNAPICLVSLVDLGRQWFLSNRGLGDVRETPRNVAFCAHTIRSKLDLFIVPDATADERFKNNALVTGEPNIRFYAGAPLITPEGYRLGTLCIIDNKIRPEGLDLTEKQNFREMAGIVMDALVTRKRERGKRVMDRGQIIACTAHDLLTPLTCIQLNMGLLTEDGDLVMNDSQKDTLQTITNCSKLMGDICNQSISSFRKETEQKVSTPTGKKVHGEDMSLGDNRSRAAERVCIPNLLEDLKRVIKPYPKMVPLIFDVKEEMPDFIVSSYLSIFRSALNFLTNACKVTEKGEIIFKIYANTQDKGDMLVFECEDTGPGVDIENYTNLFMLFGSKKRNEKDSDGSIGIGLYSVSRHIESLGGEFGYRPRIGSDKTSGSIFWFSIPLVLSDAADLNDSRAESDTSSSVCTTDSITLQKRSLLKSQHTTSDSAPVTSKSQRVAADVKEQEMDNEKLEKRKRKALIIDDSPTIRKVIERVLVRVGFEVSQAENGMEGLKEMKGTLFDVVFCDFLMPIMDGLDCVKQYRDWEKKTRPWFQQQIIGISAHADTKDIKRGIQFGMNKFLAKPISMKTLKNLCEEDEGVRAASEQLDDHEKGDQVGFSLRKEKSGPFHISRDKVSNTDDERVCLIAEDSIVCSKAISKCIEKHGWRTCVVTNGGDALRLLKLRNWDAVFMDDQLPCLTGTECIHKFRQWEGQNRVARQTSIFLASANYYLHKSIPDGFDGSIGKPFQRSDVCSILDLAAENPLCLL